MRILLLGCGNIGSNVGRQLSAKHPRISYTVADHNAAAAQALAQKMGPMARPCTIDINNELALNALCEDVDLIFNSVGPFYQHAHKIIAAAIRTGTDYIDVNDDSDVLERLFLTPETRDQISRKGIKVVVGCGGGPGLTNVMARYAADRLTQAHTVRLCAVVPFPSIMASSPAILRHTFHMLSGEVAQYIDGKYRKVPAFSGDLDVEFLEPFGSYTGFYIGHGETITLPHFIPGLREVTNRLAFFPAPGINMLKTLLGAGFSSEELIATLGVSPREFLVQLSQSPLGRKTFDVEVAGGQNGYANQVLVEGSRGDDEVQIILELHSMFPERTESERNVLTQAEFYNDPTPTCARLAIEAYINGAIKDSGLLAPESCLAPEQYLRAFVAETGISLHQSERIVSRRMYVA